MRYFTTNQIRASLLLCVLAAAGWGIRYYLAGRQMDNPLPFAPITADSAVVRAADSIRAALEAPVDVNTAGTEELQRLTGIGPELARRILEERRRRGAYANLDQLTRRVRGIGPATAAGLADRVTFNQTDGTIHGTGR
ncbi:MAG: helix-hairpin-helix domain-containing protein [Candidatus Glassbacteria bacterium]|nr:helix-hairpin-helix domain-containing protein [Candidatus Glassbacteria bacterium]